MVIYWQDIIDGILTFISRINDWLLWLKPKISIDFDCFSIYKQLKFHAHLSWDWKKFYNLGCRLFLATQIAFYYTFSNWKKLSRGE